MVSILLMSLNYVHTCYAIQAMKQYITACYTLLGWLTIP